jgi:hypothetical protein
MATSLAGRQPFRSMSALGSRPMARLASRMIAISSPENGMPETSISRIWQSAVTTLRPKTTSFK